MSGDSRGTGQPPLKVDPLALEQLCADVGLAIASLVQHRYWQLHITAGEGKVRVEHSYSDAPYTLVIRGSSIERR